MCTIKVLDWIIRGLLVAVLCTSCIEADDGPNAPSTSNSRIEVSVPANFPPPVYDLTRNPVTQEGFNLGKMLFYDTRLSRDNTISCGSCHMQPTAFTHHGHDVSHGVDDKLGRRNSLPIQNLIFSKAFFWDGGVHNLDMVPLNAIHNEVEMDEEVNNVITKLQKDDDYPLRFRKAFGTEEFTSKEFLQALSQFMAAMISSNSKYDLYIRGENQITLTESELRGLTLFQTNCATCHATDLFTDQTYRNNGFSSAADLAMDKGREEITLNAEDRGKFKVPSLRNVEYTAPYMHNGKLPTLESVLDFYTSGVNDSPTLDPLLRRGSHLGFDLNEEDKKSIIDFLVTLTDEQYMADRRFSEF